MSGRRPRLLAGVLVALAGTAALAGLSRVPYAPVRADHAVLRLSWRVRGMSVETCRRLSAEEIAALPAHMRREEVCEGRVLPYRLVVAVDGDTVAVDTVHAAGARSDRPLYVFREVALPPGRHWIAVGFDRDPEAEADRRVQERGGGRAGPVPPPSLGYRDSLTLGAGEVALITYDAERRELVRAAPDR